jgi:hypothetical protein
MASSRQSLLFSTLTLIAMGSACFASGEAAQSFLAV